MNQAVNPFSSVAVDSKPDSVMAELKPARYSVSPLIEAIAVASVILLATFSTTFFIYDRAVAAQEAEIRQGLLRTAHVAASIIDPEIHKSLTRAEDEQTERYQKALAPLVKMQNSDPQIAYLYTAVRKGDSYHFIFDTTPTSEGEDDTSVDVMQVYDDAPENLAFLRAFETEKPSTSDEPYTDEFGRFISGYVPLKNADGTMYGVLGMDIDIKDYEARLAPIRRATTRAFVAGFFIAILMASAVWFLRNFISVMNKKRLRLYDLLALTLSRHVNDSRGDDSLKNASTRDANLVSHE
jgi:hypothetical protein